MLEEIVQKEETPGEQPLSDFERARSLPLVSKMDKEQALTEISKTRADKEHPYNSSGHWHRQRALDRMDKLYRLAYPEPTKEEKEKELAQVEKESKARLEGFEKEKADKTRLAAEEKLKESISQDPELIKKGITYEKAVKMAQTVLQERGITEEDEDFLYESGHGNSPELVKALLTIGLIEREKKEWLKGKRSR